jgi:hypothetical protein
MNRKYFFKKIDSIDIVFIRVHSRLNRSINFSIKVLLLIICFTNISFSGISQNNNSDSLKSTFASNLNQLNEPLNLYYDALNNKFVIDNNTKQNHNFYIGIYNITGSPIKQFQFETLNGKSSEIPIELSAGIYIITLTDKSFSYTKKIIIR